MLSQLLSSLLGLPMHVATDGIYLVTPRSLKHYCLHPEFFGVHPSKVGSVAGVQQCALHGITPQIGVHESVLVVE